MYSAASTHKRRRSALRADEKRNPVSLLAHASSRRILSRFYDDACREAGRSGQGKGKERALDELQKRVTGQLVGAHCLQIIMPTASSSPSSVHAQRASSSKAPTALPSTLDAPSTPSLANSSGTSALIVLRISDLLTNGVLLQMAKRPEDELTLIASTASSSDGDTWTLVDGTLHLSVQRSTYLSLGLVGRPSSFCRTSSGRYSDRRSGLVERFRIDIDIRAKSFAPAKKGYERVKRALQWWDSHRNSDMHASWEVVGCWNGQQSFPLPIALDLSTRPLVKEIEDVWVPNLSYMYQSSLDHASCLDQWDQTWQHISEWSALVRLGVECIRTYARPSHTCRLPTEEWEQLSAYAHGVKIITYEGPLCPSQVQSIFYSLQKDVDAEGLEATQRRKAGGPQERNQQREGEKDVERCEAEIPWAFVSCTAWQGSCVAWRSKESKTDRAEPKTKVGGTRQRRGVWERNEAQDEAWQLDDEPSDSVPSGTEQDGMSVDSSSSAAEADDAHCATLDPSQAVCAAAGATGAKKRKKTWQGSGKAARRARSKRVQRRGHRRAGENEHAIEVAGGGGTSAGWSVLLFPSCSPDQATSGLSADKSCSAKDACYLSSRPKCRWMACENVGIDTRN
ncbi:RPP40 [Ceraceosorus bombacis]|uniref:RPP40 n=1 Tax=Ceraceosorus bombacis TaxID=401625 RepID=A0A0P1BSR6_9BASI|nr:RPP40 [Ceraceosorus bombacis]